MYDKIDTLLDGAVTKSEIKLIVINNKLKWDARVREECEDMYFSLNDDEDG